MQNSCPHNTTGDLQVRITDPKAINNPGFSTHNAKS